MSDSAVVMVHYYMEEFAIDSLVAFLAAITLSMAQLTRELTVEHRKAADFWWEQFDHPPYSPDLAPSDYHLFPRLKKELGG